MSGVFQTKTEEEEIDRTPWGELEPSDEESSEEEEEEGPHRDAYRQEVPGRPPETAVVQLQPKKHPACWTPGKGKERFFSTMFGGSMV